MDINYYLGKSLVKNFKSVLLPDIFYSTFTIFTQQFYISFYSHSNFRPRTILFKMVHSYLLSGIQLQEGLSGISYGKWFRVYKTYT